MQLRKKIYNLLEDPQHSKSSFYFNIFIYSLIIISILNLMLSTVAQYEESYGHIFKIVNSIVMPIFIVEYFLRLYASGNLAKYRGLKGKVKYVFSFYALVDLLSILPYILINIGFNSSFIRSLRLLRVFRLFRAKKYNIFIKLMQRILFNIKEEMLVLVFFTILILSLLSFSIFEIEHEAQPDVFTDIFQTLWWAVATLTTVGYGDMYPITPLGKLITGIVSLVGIAFIAIPGGMFASEFISELSQTKKSKNTKDNLGRCCPNCNSSKFITFKDASLELDGEKIKHLNVEVCKNCKHIYAKS